MITPVEPSLEEVALPALAAPRPIEESSAQPDAAPSASKPTDIAGVQIPDRSDAIISAREPLAESLPEVAAEPADLGESDVEQAATLPIGEAAPSAIAKTLAVDAPPPPFSELAAVLASAARPETFDPAGQIAPSPAPPPSTHVAAPEAVAAASSAKPELSGTPAERAPARGEAQSAAAAGISMPVEAARPEPSAIRGDGLTSSLLTQSLPGALRAAPATGPYAPAQSEPIVNARPGQIGREMGVEIVRRLTAGKDEMLIRLNPQEMGRIEVRMSFDEGGSLRAIVTAESTVALEMLRRDAGDLSRTLSDAGVRADPESFKFSSRSGDGGQGWQGRNEGGEGRRQGDPRDGDRRPSNSDPDRNEPAYRSVRASGQIDLMA